MHFSLFSASAPFPASTQSPLDKTVLYFAIQTPFLPPSISFELLMHQPIFKSLSQPPSIHSAAPTPWNTNHLLSHHIHINRLRLIHHLGCRKLLRCYWTARRADLSDLMGGFCACAFPKASESREPVEGVRCMCRCCSWSRELV